MQAKFHWIRVETFCYATEKEDLVSEAFGALVGAEEFQKEISEGEHGNKMEILQYMITKQRDMDRLFLNLGKEIAEEIVSNADVMVDDDCVFYMRLDKQRAICGEYCVAHHSDVISVTGKVASNPARKEIAVKNLTDYLNGLLSSSETPRLP